MARRSRTAAEAIEHYRASAARLLSCVTSVHVVVGAYHASDSPNQLELADAAKMRGGSFSVEVAEQYRVRQDVDGWNVEILGYVYGIQYEGRELFSYHWHPRGESSISQPHMHVAANVQVGDRWLGKVHLPTGTVGLEQVVALAIVELGVEPLRGDWERLIAEAAER